MDASFVFLNKLTIFFVNILPKTCSSQRHTPLRMFVPLQAAVAHLWCILLGVFAVSEWTYYVYFLLFVMLTCQQWSEVYGRVR